MLEYRPFGELKFFSNYSCSSLLLQILFITHLNLSTYISFAVRLCKSISRITTRVHVPRIVSSIRIAFSFCLSTYRFISSATWWLIIFFRLFCFFSSSRFNSFSWRSLKYLHISSVSCSRHNLSSLFYTRSFVYVIKNRFINTYFTYKYFTCRYQQ